MLQVCGKWICKPLEIIYKETISMGVFPPEQKKGNIVPIYKKTTNND